MTKRYNLNKDGRLGGKPSDNYVSPSQRAVKEYVDNNSYKYMKTLAVAGEESRTVDVDALYGGTVYTESIIEIRSAVGAGITASVMPLYKSIFVLVNTSADDGSEFSFDLTGMDNTSINCPGEYLDGFNRVSVTVGAECSRVVEMFMVGSSLSVIVSDSDMEVDIKVPDYLSFTAGGNGATVSMTTAAGTPPSLEYSLDGGRHFTGWETVRTRSAEEQAFSPISLESGESVMLRGVNATLAGSTFSITGDVYASGKATSLLDGSDEGVSVPAFGLASLFDGCSSLKSAPSFTGITSVGEGAMTWMFRGCSSLVSAPALPATSLGESCYSGMFENCSSLVSAPALPAAVLAGYCYSSMFKGCASLESAPALPATVLAESCYSSMFRGCALLENAPALPAAVLGAFCYEGMFENCPSLESAPALQAIALAEGCYSRMFKGCVSLESAPALPAEELAGGCYEKMFENCVFNMTDDGEGFNFRFGITEWPCTDGDIEFGTPEEMAAWMGNTNGFVSASLSFTALQAGSSVWVVSTMADAPALEYSLDGEEFEIWDSDYDETEGIRVFDTIELGHPGDTVYVRGNNPEGLSDYMNEVFTSFKFTGSVSASGDATVLINGKGGLRTAAGMVLLFAQDEPSGALKSAPSLPSTELSFGCYALMFRNCDGLAGAPELPAVSMEDFCYFRMFEGCGSLREAPALPAIALANYCYESMFAGCVSLTEAPDLPATTLANSCYSNMFKGCTFGMSDDGGETFNFIFGAGIPYNGAAGEFDYCVDAAEWMGNTRGILPNYLTITLEEKKALTTYCSISEPYDGGYNNYEGWFFAYRDPGDPGDYFTREDYPYNEAYAPVYVNNASYVIPLDHVGWNAGYYGGIDPETGDFVPAGSLARYDDAGVMMDTYTTGGVSIEYSADGGETWDELMFHGDYGTHKYSDPIFFDNVGDSVMLRGYNPLGFVGDYPSYFTALGVFSLSGSVQTIVDMDGSGTEAVPMQCLFAEPSWIWDEPYEVGSQGSGFRTAPELPATELASYCYAGMFAGQPLRRAPSLPATELAEGCYEAMFESCGFPMTYDGETFNFNFGAELPYEDNENEMYISGCASAALWMGNTEGFMKPYFPDASIDSWGNAPFMFIYGSPCVIYLTNGYYHMDTTVVSSAPLSDGGHPLRNMRITAGGLDFDIGSMYSWQIDDEIMEYILQMTEGIGPVMAELSPLFDYLDMMLAGGMYLNIIDADYHPGGVLPEIPAEGYTDISMSGLRLCSVPYKYPSSFEDIVRCIFPVSAVPYSLSVAGDASCLAASPLVTYDETNDEYNISFDICVSDEFMQTDPYIGIAEFDYASVYDYITAYFPVTSSYADCFRTGGHGHPDAYADYLDMADDGWKIYHVEIPDIQAADMPETLTIFVGIKSFGTLPVMYLDVSEPVDEEDICLWEIPGAGGELNFTFPEGGSVSFYAPDSRGVDIMSFEYSDDGGGTWHEWEDVVIDGTVVRTLSVPANGTVHVRNSSVYPMPLSRRSFGFDGRVLAAGDARSLISRNPGIGVLSYGCFHRLFYGCTTLETSPALPATTLADLCYVGMFAGCTSLTSAPALPATTLANYCYESMFVGCTSLTSAPALPAATLAEGCYDSMFEGCSLLSSITCLATDISAPVCTAGWVYGVAASGVFERHPSMKGWTVGTDGIPEGWTTAVRGALNFTMPSGGEIVLTPSGDVEPVVLEISTDGERTWHEWQAGQGGVRILQTAAGQTVYVRNASASSTGFSTADGCYTFGFTGEVRAAGDAGTLLCKTPGDAVLGDYCLCGLFAGCDTLVTAPELPAATLAEGCYDSMFMDCTSLASAPALPATTLADYCYSNMFNGCTSLTSAPELPAAVLAERCYEDMFYGCSSLSAISCLAVDISAAECTDNWVYGVAAEGVFTKSPVMEDWTTGVDGIPSGWNAVEIYDGYLNFTMPNGGYIVLDTNGSPYPVRLEYRMDGDDGWTEWEEGKGLRLLELRAGKTVYIRNMSSVPTGFSKGFDDMYQFVFSGFTRASGSVMSLLCRDYMCDTVSDFAFISLFEDCATLTAAPELPAAALGDFCYAGMFYGCTSLTSAPALPAITLADDCYDSMFSGCASLTTAPALPATALAEGCYAGMFKGCTSLTSAPVLPATTLAPICYREMFFGCTSLTAITCLATDISAPECTTGWVSDVAEAGMFVGNSLMEDWTTGDDGIPLGWDFDYIDVWGLNFAMPRGGNITLTKTGSPTAVTLEYRVGMRGSWTEWTETGGVRTLSLNAGDTVYIRNASSTSTGFSTSAGDYYSFGFSGAVSAAGDVMSLLCAYPGMGELTRYCFYNLFRGCTSLTTAPELFAETLAETCYSNMFHGCTSLVSPPVLPAATLAAGCYAGMFQNCASLVSSPVLPAAVLAEGCYQGMFSGCTSLSGVACLATDISAANCTTNWVQNVAASGTFIKDTGMSDWTTGTSGIPSGWTSQGNGILNFTMPDGGYITLNADGSPYPVRLEYRMDGDDGWTEWEEVEYGVRSLSLDAGGTVYIRNASLTGTGFSIDESNYYYFGFDGLVSAAGDVRSLLCMVPGYSSLKDNCFYDLFYDCTSLTTAPALPATTLAQGCYNYMFYGCTSLTVAPALPATTMEYYCYYGMFFGCTSLTSAPALPATTLAEGCYESMFVGCTSLTAAPALPATTMEYYCYDSMFYGCTSLTSAPLLPATTLAEGCYSNMFLGCTSLTAAPALPATTMEYYCYDSMFYGCTALTTASLLPATTLDLSCYYRMFYGCTALTSAPALPATTMEYYCYAEMFYGCTSLTTAPALPATTLANNCYNNMFYGCTNLTSAPALPATTLANDCYRTMFQNCTALTSAPVLPATRLITECYYGMFIGCTSLTSAPALPATTLAQYCYYEMFRGCTALTVAPELPATTLAQYCYQYMFRGCTNLTSAPVLPATTLATHCYSYMFQDCTRLSSITCLATNISATSCTMNWVQNVAASGTFYKNQSMGSWTTGSNGVPSGWTVKDDGLLNFTMPNGGDMTLTKTGSPTAVTLQYRVGLSGSWTEWTETNNVRTLTLGAGDTVYIRNASSTSTGFSTSAGDYYSFGFTDVASGDGDIRYLLCSTPSDASLTAGCFYRLFSGCTALTVSPKLPSTTLATSCYSEMFLNCESLTSAPELPATTLAESCYQMMFSNCESLAYVPDLPATTLAKNCCTAMFLNCTSLVNAPALPATTLAQSCYQYMFWVCESLENAPALPATVLADSCYNNMFNGCSSLVSAPALPATTLAGSCYHSMFYGCTSLTAAPVLPANTLASQCYQSMFNGCSSLAAITCLATDINYPTCVTNWVSGVAANGTFTKNPGMSLTLPYGWTTGDSGIPSGWTVQNDDDAFLNFTMPDGGDITLTKTGSPTAVSLEYCVNDSGSWTAWTETNNVRSLTLNAGDTVYIRNSSVTSTGFSTGANDYYTFGFSGTASASGDVRSLLCSYSGSGVLTQYCFYKLFFGCTSLTAAPTLPATTLANYCYYGMFYGCTSLTTAPALPATTMVYQCYKSMFNGCTSLTTAPSLPATTLNSSCYESMFYGCTALTTAPALPAITLVYKCYATMFSDCTSLTAAPVLPATTLAYGCYSYMFAGCTSLTTAPALPATTLARYCYESMFLNCESLTAASALPATTLVDNCYRGMFSGCASLTSAPSLPATTLVEYCYRHMFSNCTSLTSAPSLPATTLVNECYNSMFAGCTHLTSITCLATDISATNCTTNWVQDVAASGTFTKHPSMSDWTTGNNGVPSGWIIKDDGPLNFTMPNGGTVTLTKYGSPTSVTLEYRIGLGGEWTEWTESNNVRSLTLEAGDTVYLRNTSVTSTRFSINETSYYKFGFTGIAYAYGNIMSLNSKYCISLISSYNFYRLFYGCTSLTSAPALPATTLASSCYTSMFEGCTSLTSAPELPAATLADYCYNGMFMSCTSLTTSPVLSATKLSSGCYHYMFYNCTSLKTAPVLSAKVLNSYCYKSMFEGCRSLEAAPVLLATTLRDYCYTCMFKNCTSLTIAPVLSATTLVWKCYYEMFYNCALLTSIICLATDISALDCIVNWVKNVAASGTFTKHPSMSNWTAGDSGIPSGWTVQDAQL